MIRKQDPSICCLQETHFRPKDTFRLKIRGGRTIYHANGQQKKAGVAILISDNLDFKVDCIKRCRRAFYHNQGVYRPRRPNNCKHLCTKYEAPKYINKVITNTKKLIENNSIRDFNTPLTAMDRWSNKKINKETMA